MAKSSKKANPPAITPGIDAAGLFNLFMQGLDPRQKAQSEANVAQSIMLDMFSTDHCIIIEAELPGIKPNELELSFVRNSLIIKAVKYDCLDEVNVNYVCMERSFGKLTRTIELPSAVNSNKIKAVYKNGILSIEMPRVEDKRGQPKPIPIEFEEK